MAVDWQCDSMSIVRMSVSEDGCWLTVWQHVHCPNIRAQGWLLTDYTTSCPLSKCPCPWMAADWQYYSMCIVRMSVSKDGCWPIVLQHVHRPIVRVQGYLLTDIITACPLSKCPCPRMAVVWQWDSMSIVRMSMSREDCWLTVRQHVHCPNVGVQGGLLYDSQTSCPLSEYPCSGRAAVWQHYRRPVVHVWWPSYCVQNYCWPSPRP